MFELFAKRVFLGLFILGGLSLPMTSMEAQELKVGVSFPELILPRAHDGLPDSLAGYRGQKTVLHVFASW